MSNVSIWNFSKGGRKAKDLLDLIDKNQLSHLKKPYTLILICLGGNDFLSGKPPRLVGEDAVKVAEERIIPAMRYFRDTPGWLASDGTVRFLLPPPRADPLYKFYSNALHNRLRQQSELKSQIGKISKWYTGDGSPAARILNPNDRSQVHLSDDGYFFLNNYLIGLIAGGGRRT